MSFSVYFCVPYCIKVCPLLYKSVSHTPLRLLLSQGLEYPLTVLLTALLTDSYIKRARANLREQKIEVLAL